MRYPKKTVRVPQAANENSAETFDDLVLIKNEFIKLSDGFLEQALRALANGFRELAESYISMAITASAQAQRVLFRIKLKEARYVG